MNAASTLRKLVLLSLLALSACVYTPRHEIKTDPAHIRAGVEPGDRVEVVTLDGRQLEFEVTVVENDALLGDAERVSFLDIAALYKLSWKEPGHPCGGGQPVGCSIPTVVAAVSGNLAGYGNRFHKACMYHDFCYRHGYATYGNSRDACDDQFRAAMETECGTLGVLDIMDLERAQEHTRCTLAAEQMYLAVRRYGEKAYLTTQSTFCEY